MYKNKQKNTSKKRIFISLIIGLSAISALVLLLELSGVTNLYSATPKTDNLNGEIAGIPSANPANTVDYTSPKPEDSTVVPDKNPDPQVTPNPDLAATITNTRLNSSGSHYLVKVAVIGAESGSCSLVMSSGSKSVSADSDISLLAGQYGCTNLEIPITELTSSPTWKAEVTVTDTNGSSVVTNSEVIL